MQKCTLALGCFWKPEENFKNKPGILKTEVGYAGGSSAKTTYEEVCTGNTGHAEVVRPYNFSMSSVSCAYFFVGCFCATSSCVTYFSFQYAWFVFKVFLRFPKTSKCKCTFLHKLFNIF